MPKTNGSKTNVSARLGAKKATIEQRPQVIDLRSMRSSMVGTVTEFPAKTKPETDDQRKAVADFENFGRLLKNANPKTSTYEKPYSDAHARMLALGLTD